MMGHKEKLKDGCELDVVCARRWYKWRPGHARYIKNKMIRRNRREAKLYLSKHNIAG